MTNESLPHISSRIKIGFLLILCVVIFLFIKTVTKHGYDFVEDGVSATTTQPVVFTESDIKKITQEKLGFSENIQIDSLALNPTTDLVIINDIGLSGAYNMFTIPFLFKKTVKGVHIEPVYIIRTDNKNEVVNLSKEFLSKEVDVRNVDMKEYNYNNYITQEDNLFHIYGIKPFGIYPCNIDERYQFENDRFVLVSKHQAQECEGAHIELPGDISKYFPRFETEGIEGTDHEIYKVTPQMFEQAKKVMLY